MLPTILFAAATIGVAPGLTKIRPGNPVPAATSATLDAARNELEPFQIVVNGGAGGVTGVSASAGALSGPGGAQIAANEITLYRVGLYQVVTPSNTEGAPGFWPDPLIPDVDTYAGETRNAFPFDVPAGESRAIWVEVFVPPGTPAGMYSGTVTVTAGGAPTSVPVSLRVRNFDLPSTATLKSAFGMGWDDACVAHKGSYAACGDAGVEAFHILYDRAALDHRISLESVVYDGPHTGDWTHFDALYGPLLDGTAQTRLAGAKQTTLRLTTSDPVELGQWQQHFAGKNWAGALFDYTCDEPPNGCAFSDIPGRADPIHTAGLRTLVTTDIDAIVANMLGGAIDIAVPIVNAMHDKGGVDRRADYDPFLASSSAKEIWSYQSCESHGCGNGCVTTTDPYFTGWPSYMIDASALQNRAMEWISWNEKVTGELYFETTMHLATAWDPEGVCDFSGQGDGTLFYPGTPARIGGTTDIPVESIRLKMIREGMEDYEYLALCAKLGDPALADHEAATLFPAPYLVTAATPDELYAARKRLADRIEQLSGMPGVDSLIVKHAPTAGVTIDGDTAEWDGATTLVVGAGAAQATFRMMWDADNLYLAADVTDPDLWVIGTGRDGALYDGDGVELMLDPLDAKSAQPDATDRHIVVNAAGDLLDAVGAGPTESVAAMLGVTVAVKARGTLGDTSADQGYTVEFSVPWQALGVTQPAAMLSLGGDLALNDATATTLASADWAGLTAFAQPAHWKTLTLSADIVGGGGTPPPTGGKSNGCAIDRPGARPGALIPVALLAGLALITAARRRPRR